MTYPPLNGSLTASFHAANAALAVVSKEVSEYRGLDDAALLELGRLSAVQQQYATAHAALIAGEIARRSHHTLGYAGLAQRTGHRTARELVRATTGVRGRDAATAVKVGVILHQAQDAGIIDTATGEIATPDKPWLDPVARAVTVHGLSTEAARAIANGLGTPCKILTPVPVVATSKASTTRSASAKLNAPSAPTDTSPSSSMTADRCSISDARCAFSANNKNLPWPPATADVCTAIAKNHQAVGRHITSTSGSEITVKPISSMGQVANRP